MESELPDVEDMPGFYPSAWPLDDVVYRHAVCQIPGGLLRLDTVPPDSLAFTIRDTDMDDYYL